MCETIRMLGWYVFSVAQVSHEPIIGDSMGWNLFLNMQGVSELLMFFSGEEGRNLDS